MFPCCEYRRFDDYGTDYKCYGVMIVSFPSVFFSAHAREAFKYHWGFYVVTSEVIRLFVPYRYRYLSHLPLTCVFNMVELDMKPPDVSCEILHNFENEANQRRHARQMKLQ